MATVRMRGGSGEERAVPVEAIEALGAQLRGSLARPGEPGYDEARTIWNGMIDRRPALVVRCAGAADVRAAVRPPWL